MIDKRFVEKLRAEIERDAQRPTRERWDELVRRGAIDAKGNVLLRGPDNETQDDPAPRND